MSLTPFHLAFPVPCLTEARAFFTGVLGCTEGRSAARWVDFDFFGHQISAHLAEEANHLKHHNGVDGDRVPCRHFGLIVKWDDWEALKDRFEKNGSTFVIKPKIRFRGEPGEQGTMFVQGPGDNVLEFKTFRDFGGIFST